MTEPSIYAEDVSKLKDADELKQACIGLKDTNRYSVTESSPPGLHIFHYSVLNPLQAPNPPFVFPPSYSCSVIKIPVMYMQDICV